MVLTTLSKICHFFLRYLLDFNCKKIYLYERSGVNGPFL